MIIDASHRSWIVATLAVFVVATAGYVVYAALIPGGPWGGSWPGLIYGIAGSALMLFAGLLSARKKYPTMRVGRAATWLKGHIWLGLLSVPLILYHAAFRLGGPLERWLWGAFALIILSGIVGLALQQILPRTMSDRVPLETIFEQIPRVCEAMQNEADELVEAICGPLPAGIKPAGEEEKGPKRGAKPKLVAGGEPLKDFYVREVRPFLGPVHRRSSRLAVAATAESVFEQMRKRLPPELEAPLEQLGGYCEERRQLAYQVRLHHWLHGWLLLHVPLSFALLALGLAHAVMSVYY